jgi:hypothetical protein
MPGPTVAWALLPAAPTIVSVPGRRLRRSAAAEAQAPSIEKSLDAANKSVHATTHSSAVFPEM